MTMYRPTGPEPLWAPPTGPEHPWTPPRVRPRPTGPEPLWAPPTGPEPPWTPPRPPPAPPPVPPPAPPPTPPPSAAPPGSTYTPDQIAARRAYEEWLKEEAGAKRNTAAAGLTPEQGYGNWAGLQSTLQALRRELGPLANVSLEDMLRPPPAQTPTVTAGPQWSDDRAAPVAPSPAPTTGPIAPPPDPFREAFRNSLLRLLQTNTTNASITDPDLQPEADAYRGEQERAREARRSAAAERFSTQGLGTNSGAFDAEVASGYEDAGRKTAAFNAELVGRKLTERRDQLMQALQMGGQYLSSQDQLALQREVSLLDAQLRREGYGTQERIAGGQLGLGYAGLGTQERIAGGQLGLGYAGLGTQERIAGGQLGLGYAGLQQQGQLSREGMQLQRDLADIDAALRREGYSLQKILGMGDIELRKVLGQGQLALGAGQLNLGLLNALLGNEQFRQQLGANLGMFQANLNRDALLELLKGLGLL